MGELIDARIEIGVIDFTEAVFSCGFEGDFPALRRKPSPINIGVEFIRVSSSISSSGCQAQVAANCLMLLSRC